MKKKYISSFAILIVIIAAFVFALSKNAEDRIKSNEERLNLISKNLQKRKILDSSLKELSRYNYQGKGFLVFSYFDDIFLIDNRQNKVISLSNKLKFKREFGKSGDSPAEHRSLKHYRPLNNKQYFTFDFSQQMIKKFDKNDSLLFYMNFKNDSLRISDCTYINKNTFLTAGSSDLQFYFLVIDIKANEILKYWTIDDILEKKVDRENIPTIGRELIFEGYFSQSDQGDILYSYNKTGLFSIFSPNGEFTGTYQTIDKNPLPRFLRKDIGRGIKLSTLEPDFYGNYSRAINSNHVFILSNFLMPDYNDNRIIDVYDKIGNYKHSFFVQNLEDGQRADQIVALDNHLFVLYENSTIVNYELNI